MGLYEKWCDSTKEDKKRKHYWTYVEKDGGRDEINDDLVETIRSHYDRLERIAEDVKRLGFKVASEILSAAMPQTPKGRSGVHPALPVLDKAKQIAVCKAVIHEYPQLAHTESNEEAPT